MNNFYCKCLKTSSIIATESSGCHYGCHPRPNHFLDPFDKYLPPFALPPPPANNIIARRSNSFKHRKSIDATICDKQTIYALQNKNDEQSTSVNLPYLKTASDSSSEIFSLLYQKLSSS